MSLNIITKNAIKANMTKTELIQARSYQNNKKGIKNILKLLEKLGRGKTEIMRMPEKWLPNNQIKNCNQEFFEFKKVEKILNDNNFRRILCNKWKKYELIHRL